MKPTQILDAALDRSLVLGYTRIGPALRRLWWPDDAAPGCLAGRRVLVTGATSGIGLAMAASFAGLGATVHVLGRNPDRLDDALAALRGEQPEAEFVGELCDVGDLDAVRRWTTDLGRRIDVLHGIVHNAGVITPTRTVSPQGHELQLAVHVLGPHLITERLLPLLDAAPGSVVWMSSGGMYSAGLRSTPDEIQYRDGDYDGVRAYARTKRMQVVLADAWAARLAERGGPDVRVESTHPGWAATASVSEALPGFDKVLGPLFRTPASGADTAVWLVATRPRSPGAHHFWHDRATRPTTYPWQFTPEPGAEQAFLAYVALVTG